MLNWPLEYFLNNISYTQFRPGLIYLIRPCNNVTTTWYNIDFRYNTMTHLARIYDMDIYRKWILVKFTLIKLFRKLYIGCIIFRKSFWNKINTKLIFGAFVLKFYLVLCLLGALKLCTVLTLNTFLKILNFRRTRTKSNRIEL